MMRKPVDVVRVDYIVLAFGPDGRLESANRRRGEELVAEILGQSVFRVPGPVVEFGPFLAERQYRSEFKWEPTEQQAKAVVEFALER